MNVEGESDDDGAVMKANFVKTASPEIFLSPSASFLMRNWKR